MLELIAPAMKKMVTKPTQIIGSTMFAMWKQTLRERLARLVVTDTFVVEVKLRGLLVPGLINPVVASSCSLKKNLDLNLDLLCI